MPSFTEPFFLDRRLAAGFDLFSKQTFNSQYSRYDQDDRRHAARGPAVQRGILDRRVVFALFAASDDPEHRGTAVQRLYLQPWQWHHHAEWPKLLPLQRRSIGCGQAGAGHDPHLACGSGRCSTTRSTTRRPRTSGILAELRPEVAGLGGDSKFFRVTADARYFYPTADEVTGILRAQGGHISGIGKVDNTYVVARSA